MKKPFMQLGLRMHIGYVVLFTEAGGRVEWRTFTPAGQVLHDISLQPLITPFSFRTLSLSLHAKPAS
jgi:hypothetical protein